MTLGLLLLTVFLAGVAIGGGLTLSFLVINGLRSMELRSHALLDWWRKER